MKEKKRIVRTLWHCSSLSKGISPYQMTRIFQRESTLMKCHRLLSDMGECIGTEAIIRRYTAYGEVFISKAIKGKLENKK